MEIDIRVRSVLRHHITRRRPNGDEGAVVESICEVANEAMADEIAELFRKAGAPKKYAIIERTYSINAKCIYAEEYEQALEYKKQLEEFFDAEFRIFEAELTDPVKVAQANLRVPGTWSPLNLLAMDTPPILSDKEISELASRLMSWPVPASVRPDGIPGQPGRTGTNLLSVDEAKQMLSWLFQGNS
jgi:hypothetical protein